MSNIRSRLISTNQGVTPGAATSLVIAPAGVDVTILDYSGYCYAGDNATPFWIMFFAQATVPTNGTQPLYKEQVYGANGFKFNYMPKGISSATMMTLDSPVPVPNTGGLIAVLSSTGETLTIATGGGNKMDLDVFIEDYETLQAGTTLTGDTSTAVSSLQVWSEASGVGTANLQGSKQLLKVWATNNSGATLYLQLFAQDAPVTNAANPALAAVVYIPQPSNPVVGGAPVQAIAVNAQLVPIEEWELAAGASLVENCGDPNSGIIPLSIDPGTITIRRGCSLFVSTTAGYLTAPGSAGWTIQAQYK